MPRSRRDKTVSLTKVGKKGREIKSKLIDEIRQCIDAYERVFVFSVDNMRNDKLKDVRMNFKSNSRFFFGKTKVMALALGRLRQDEFRENLHLLSKRLVGQCGLLFTNVDESEVLSYFADFCEPEFARSGATASQTVKIEAGPLDHLFAHSIEPQLRLLGLPTQMTKGVITLPHEHFICKEGDKLTPEQAKLLKLFGFTTTEFKINLLCVWNRVGCRFQSLVKKNKKKVASSNHKTVSMDTDECLVVE